MVSVFVDVFIFVSNVHIHAAILAQRHPLHDFKANYRVSVARLDGRFPPKAHKNQPKTLTVKIM